jgi:CheY-specific phosphatase CheX
MSCGRFWRRKMIEEITRLIRSVVPNVFETMFFVFFEPAEDEETTAPPASEGPAAASEWIQSAIAFQGNEYTGTIRLSLPYEVSRRLAADFIGTGEPVSEMQTRDMVGEITNMIAGNLFSHLDKKERYTISVPRTELMPGPDAHPDDRKSTFYFFCDEERIRVDIELDAETGSGSRAARP